MSRTKRNREHLKQQYSGWPYYENTNYAYHYTCYQSEYEWVDYKNFKKMAPGLSITIPDYYGKGRQKVLSKFEVEITRIWRQTGNIKKVVRRKTSPGPLVERTKKEIALAESDSGSSRLYYSSYGKKHRKIFNRKRRGRDKAALQKELIENGFGDFSPWNCKDSIDSWRNGWG